jgi:hypothetical protein
VIERWLAAVRDHPERPPALQRLALTCLALRMDWTTGRGYASTGQLAADTDAEERTVRRATGWARDTGLLLRTRRGHRLGNGRVTASEWQLTQPVTGDLLTSSQPDNGRISTGLQHTTIKSPLHQESNARASAARDQDQDQNQGQVGDSIADKEQPIANSQASSRWSGNDGPDAQRIPSHDSESPAADRYAREDTNGTSGGAAAPLPEPAEPAASDATTGAPEDPEEHKRRVLADFAAWMRDHPEAAP